MLPDAPPAILLDTFLLAHAQGTALPVGLYARGEELYQRLSPHPPALPTCGRFLVAMGQLAAEHLDDAQAASRFFLTALQGAEIHGDHESAVTAGYNQGVLLERRRGSALALAAYRAAASEGFRLGCITANTLRAGTAAVRLHFADSGELSALETIAKQTWLSWLWLRQHDPAQFDVELLGELGRQLCAFLLPEDDPSQLAERWRAWPPHTINVPDGEYRDDGRMCLDTLYAVAAESADQHLRDEGNDPGAPYRMLRVALARQKE